ncbi:MAG: hypothetical protein LQ338_004184 [Usnochroma carphineum]|nr:MAG: hypothetical protein LQ338_004184 [Usnochroma carphineum]
MLALHHCHIITADSVLVVLLSKGPKAWLHTADLRNGPKRRIAAEIAARITQISLLGKRRLEILPVCFTVPVAIREYMHRLSENPARSWQLLSRRCLLRPVPSYCAQPCRAFATTFHLKDDNHSRPPKVTWYQQLFPGARQKQPLGDREEDPALLEVSEELRKRISKLENEIKELRGDRPQNPAEQESLIEPLLEHLSEEDRRKVRLALQQAELSDAEEAEVEAESEALAKKAVGKLAGGYGAEILQQIEWDDLETALDLEPQEIPHFRRFGTCLRNAADNNSDPKVRKDLWVSYQRCKRLLPSFLQHLPDQCWDVLWKNQYASPSSGRDRAPHLNILAQDMLQSGKELSTEQRATIIETLLGEGRLDEAQAQWDLLVHSSRKDEVKSCGLQGVRLFVARGDLGRAQEIADTIFEAGKPDTARCLIPVIEGWAKDGTENGIRNAWNSYLNLRSKLGSTIQIDDFDRVAMCFINAGRTDVAMAVFKDMMLTGRESDHGSNQLYKTSLALIGLLQSRSASPSEVTSVSLNALTTLPRRFQNKFFYGSWIKKLIGLGEVNAAVSVIELMYERGVTPDAKHVNGVIGAWLRSGQAAHKEKAERLAWAMIQQRLQAVQKRRGEDPGPSINSRDDARRQVPSQIQRVVPSATIETFSLLLQYYERRRDSDAVRDLKKHLDLAVIPPNSYFMNHMLYAELRRGQQQVAWQIYQKMKVSVKPDLETYACLWDCKKAHLDRLSMHSTDDFPGPRRIFREFIEWYKSLERRRRLAVVEEFTQELYNQIMRCMCLAKDLEGTLITLYALKKYFGFLPNEETFRMIPMQVARIGLEEPRMTRKRRRSRLSDLAGSKTRIANVSKVLDLVVEQRIEVLNHNGVKLEECSTERQNEEQVHILAEFLRTVMRRYDSDEQAINDAITAAAEEMGVGGIELGDSTRTG